MHVVVEGVYEMVAWMSIFRDQGRGHGYVGRDVEDCFRRWAGLQEQPYSNQSALACGVTFLVAISSRLSEGAGVFCINLIRERIKNGLVGRSKRSSPALNYVQILIKLLSLPSFVIKPSYVCILFPSPPGALILVVSE